MSPLSRTGSARWAHGWAQILLAALLVHLEAVGLIAQEAKASDSEPDSTFVCRIEIELSAEQLDSLKNHPRRYVRASARVDQLLLENVGLHLKGQGSFQEIDKKPGLTLDFGRFTSTQRFRGMSKVHLNNSVQDGSYVREWIGSELFRVGGVPAPRVSYALVLLNRRPLGLYVLKEGFDDAFFVRAFGRADGSFYDIEEGHDVNMTMNRRQMGPSNDLGAVAQKQLAEAIEVANLPERWRRLEAILDVPRFIAFMATEVMIDHWDGYCMARNNFRIYQPSNGRLIFLPSGMDQIFANARLTWRPHMAGKVANAIMEIPAGREAYEETFRRLFHAHFSSLRISNEVNQILSLIRPVLSGPAFDRIQRESREVCNQVAQREQFLSFEMGKQPGRLLLVPASGAPLSEASWEPVDSPANGRLQEVRGPDGRPALQILVGAQAAASWRTTVRLSQGRYRFEGMARATGVIPLPFGKHQGAALRVAGFSWPTEPLIGTSSGWNGLSVAFEVKALEEDVELVCELRAGKGEALFRRESLKLIRIE